MMQSRNKQEKEKKRVGFSNNVREPRGTWIETTRVFKSQGKSSKYPLTAAK